MTRGADKHRRRILVSGGLAPGGVETHVNELCRVLRRRGADVTIAAVASAWPPDEINDLRKEGVRILTTPFGWGRGSLIGKFQALATWPMLLRDSFDTLYCHGHGRMHRWMRRFLSAEGACVYHEIVDLTDKAPPVVLRPADFIIANSHPVAANWSRLHARDRIRVLPFLTSRAPLPPPAAREPVGGRVLRIAFLGRLVKHKQPDWLVREWLSIVASAQLAPARIDFYGSDPDSDIVDRLRQFVRSRNLQDSIALHGEYRVAEIPRILANTDLVVLPSEQEGLPLVLVESMMHGVPFVAMAAGGTADLANPNVEVVPIDKRLFVEGLARMAARLRTGQVDARQLHTWAERRFGYDWVAEQWHTVLTEPRKYFEQSESGSLIAG